MNEENRESVSKPVVEHPQAHSVEGLLRHLDPGPDDETERFIEAIYDDRRKSAKAPPRE
jgi:hypothetical protein